MLRGPAVADLAPNLRASIQTGKVGANFSQPDWTLHKGFGERSTTRRVDFSEPFSQPPVVTASLIGLDTDDRQHQRLSVSVSNVSNSGFNIVFGRWDDSIVYGLEANWIAIGF